MSKKHELGLQALRKHMATAMKNQPKSCNPTGKLPSLQPTSQSLLQMASPNPEPPYRRVGEVSTWVKELNSRPISAEEIPMPVSLTLKRRFTGGPPASSED